MINININKQIDKRKITKSRSIRGEYYSWLNVQVMYAYYTEFRVPFAYLNLNITVIWPTFQINGPVYFIFVVLEISHRSWPVYKYAS